LPQILEQSIIFWIAIAYACWIGAYIIWKLWRTMTGRAGIKEWKDTTGP
jgi:hypothetical protein